MFKLIWKPKKQVGDIHFGQGIQSLLGKYHLKHLPDEEGDGVDWAVYGTEEHILRVYLRNGVVTSVACYENCVYEEQNLIGLSIHDVFHLLNCPPRNPDDMIEMIDGDQEIYEIPERGAQIWTKDSLVVTVFCSD